ncbi:hypothetical protein [Ancylobacter amanitiformis]|uniref:Uncharacterized protein n=1 Tax=Ancylobacter amanitiformis TaxID=217069 RepID=A0ABU0LQ87_9HYPH|nr:hypothetical protein [Ancylobacter amanitiformis]MDQ0510865.1 hypothetical protein [Ancylobacter amanitiformis]
MTTTRMKVTAIALGDASATVQLMAERSDPQAEPVDLTVLFMGRLETLAAIEPGAEIDVTIALVPA